MNLVNFIQPQHLTDKAITKFNIIKKVDYLKGVIIDDFIHSDIIETIQPVIYKEAKYKEYFRLYSKKRFVTEEEWHKANEDDRLFRLNYINGTYPDFASSNHWLTFTRLRSFFVNGFPLFFQNINGALLTRIGIITHAITHKDFLKIHSDVDTNRDICIVFYITMGWDSKDGGALHMIANDKEINKIEYLCNRLVIFSPSKSTNHYVDKNTNISDNKTRATLVAWYRLSG